MKSIGRNCVALLLALVSVAVAKASTVDTLAVESKAMNKKVDVTVVVPDNVEKGQKLGALTVRAGEQVLATVPIVAPERVERLTWLQLTGQILRQICMSA